MGRGFAAAAVLPDRSSMILLEPSLRVISARPAVADVARVGPLRPLGPWVVLGWWPVSSGAANTEMYGPRVAK